MKRSLSMLAIAVLGGAMASDAWAHGRASFGLYVSPSWIWYYPPPVYYPYPPVVVIPPRPSSAVPADSAQTDAAENYWYYCKHADRYYPYIRHCPEGWQRVPPVPPVPPDVLRR